MEDTGSDFDIDVELFIQQVKEHRTLWDMRSEEYKDKIKKQSAWGEVCSYIFPDFNLRTEDEKHKLSNNPTAISKRSSGECNWMGDRNGETILLIPASSLLCFDMAVSFWGPYNLCPPKIVKKLSLKWKNIRDNYARSHRKRISGQSCGRRYIHGRQLAFLEDTLAIAFMQPSTDDPLSHSPLSQHMDEEMTAYYVPLGDPDPGSSYETKRVAPKRRHDFMESSFMKSPIVEPPDPDRSFFDSILPMVRNFSEDQKLDFRSEVLDIIRKIKKNNNFLFEEVKKE